MLLTTAITFWKGKGRLDCPNWNMASTTTRRGGRMTTTNQAQVFRRRLIDAINPVEWIVPDGPQHGSRRAAERCTKATLTPAGPL
jgi:hypothetical protein